MQCPLCHSTKTRFVYGRDHKKVVAKSIFHKKGCPRCQNKPVEMIEW